MSNSTACKYNQGDIQFPTRPSMTTTLIFISVEYHWFQENVVIDFKLRKLGLLKSGFSLRGFKERVFRLLGSFMWLSRLVQLPSII